jgi:hypothetical protein
MNNQARAQNKRELSIRWIAKKPKQKDRATHKISTRTTQER